MVGNTFTNIGGSNAMSGGSNSNIVENPLTTAPSSGALATARTLALALCSAGLWVGLGSELPRPSLARLPRGKSVQQIEREFRAQSGASETDEQSSSEPMLSPLWRIVTRYGGTVRTGGRVELLRGPLLRPELGDIARFGAGKVCPVCGSLMVNTKLYIRPLAGCPDAGFMVVRSCLRSLHKAIGGAVECNYIEIG